MSAPCAMPDATSSGGTIGAGVVRALVEAVEAAGVSRATFYRLAQLEPGPLQEAEARLSGFKVYKLCELALDVTGDPAFGLHWAERLQANALGPVSHLVAHSATLRQGFDSLARFNRLLCDYMPYELLERDDTVTVRCKWLPGPARMHRFSSEMIMAFFFRVLREFDRHALPERVCFAYEAPEYASEYARVFERTARFGQSFTGMVFERALLDRPAPHKDDDVHEVLQALAERRLLRMAQGAPYALRVRDLLVRQGLPHRSDMATVARALGMSSRSLRRRLGSEGKSYNEVVNEALATLAKRLLRDQQRTIQETSFEMGFSDPRTFHRAFKRWTGMTPSSYRDVRTRP